MAPLWRFNNNLSDWDGTTNLGRLVASFGTLIVRDDTSFPFGGSVEAGGGIGSAGRVFADGFELDFDSASTIQLDNGRYQSTTATDFRGIINVEAGSESQITTGGAATFHSSTVATLNDDLRVSSPDTVVQAGATFTGGGALVNDLAARLTLEDGANLDVLLLNEGELALGASPGQAAADEFQQASTGEIEIEILTMNLSDIDRLTLDGAAQLDGALSVTLLNEFEPAFGSMFPIISAPGGVFDRFAKATFPVLGAGLGWTVNYNPTNVILEVVLAGDYNDDGVVGEADYTIWRDNLGAPAGTLPNDADGGVIGKAHYDTWKANFGLSAPGSGSAQNAPVPEPTSLLLLMGLAAVGMCGRCGRLPADANENKSTAR